MREHICRACGLQGLPHDPLCWYMRSLTEAIRADRERLLEALISTVANYEGLSPETRKQDIAKIQEIFDNTARR